MTQSRPFRMTKGEKLKGSFACFILPDHFLFGKQIIRSDLWITNTRLIAVSKYGKRYRVEFNLDELKTVKRLYFGIKYRWTQYEIATLNNVYTLAFDERDWPKISELIKASKYL